MYSSIRSAVLLGIVGAELKVECDLAQAKCNFTIVGLADKAINESRERCTAAIFNSGFRFPQKKITINLSPANIKKEGSHTDLPIAISILEADGVIEERRTDDFVFLGELGLDGKIVPIDGVLPMVLSMRDMGFKKFVVPYENRMECSILDDVKVYPVKTLKETVEFLNGNLEIAPSHIVEPMDLEPEYDVDFSEIKSQENLKRAFEIAAAGNHNILIIGPPGSGKTMAARRLPTILPDMTLEESIESTKIYSVSGLLKETGLMRTRPFRSPHHTASSVSIVGGGRIPKPGEVSLAHNGVLFLDELPEFQRSTLEVLRQPMEDKVVSISRINAQIKYPANFMFVASMNPCPCGYYGDPNHNCTCTQSQIDRYLGKISNPLLDRIDIHVEVNAVKYDELKSDKPAETSKEIRKRVNKARNRQIERYKDIGITNNAELNGKAIKKFIHLGEAETQILDMAYKKYKFSARAYNKILKLSRTIADLAESDEIKTEHVLEALRYRSFDSKYF